MSTLDMTAVTPDEGLVVSETTICDETTTCGDGPILDDVAAGTETLTAMTPGTETLTPA